MGTLLDPTTAPPMMSLLGPCSKVALGRKTHPGCRSYFRRSAGIGRPKPAPPFSYRVLPDMGSTKSIIALDVGQRHGLYVDQNGKSQLTDASGGDMKVEGVCQLRV